MFGDQNNQQQTQDNNGAFQAAMPDPIPDSTLGAATSDPLYNSPPVSAPATGAPDYDVPEIPANVTPDPAPSDTQPQDNDELMNLKQQALQHLSPLVSHLNQTPEEKFRTTMMMIQASDDQTLIKSAFEAAQTITDDKARAQALLDIINEINYFTQRR